MRVFVSWSGELSREIAEILKKWIPCIVQSVEVFFSDEDIEKGANWDNIISTELSQCNYGIVCLTQDNISAPWVNFEAGAIAKSLDSKVSALMVNIKPSDIKGPLSRYQATKFEEEDFYKLICSINNSLEPPLEQTILKNTFNGIWTSLKSDVENVISRFLKSGNKNDEKVRSENDPLEEILQLLRVQNSRLSSPEVLFPIDYIDFIIRRINERNHDLYIEKDRLWEDLITFMNNVIRILEKESGNMAMLDYVQEIKLIDLIQIMSHYVRRSGNKRFYIKINELEKRYYNIVRCEHNRIEDVNFNEGYVLKKAPN